MISKSKVDVLGFTNLLLKSYSDSLSWVKRMLVLVQVWKRLIEVSGCFMQSEYKGNPNFLEF